MERVRIRLLGPFEAEVGGRPADLGGPRQRAALALLRVARGEVVPVDGPIAARCGNRVWLPMVDDNRIPA